MHNAIVEYSPHYLKQQDHKGYNICPFLYIRWCIQNINFSKGQKNWQKDKRKVIDLKLVILLMVVNAFYDSRKINDNSVRYLWISEKNEKYTISRVFAIVCFDRG